MTTRASSTKPGTVFAISTASMLKTSTARELYDAMLEIYPERANLGSPWGGANKAKGLAQAKSVACWHGKMDRQCWSGIFSGIIVHAEV